MALTDRVVQRVPTRFIHAGHHALIGKEGCSKCHAVTAGAAHPVVDASYGRCSGCHDGVPNHGQRCDACHGGAGHKEVAKVEVQRPAVAEAAFRLDHAQHPAITARGGDVHATAAGRPCSDCHRNRTAELGAAGARRFQHAHHLGADRSNAACTTCHLSVPEARSSVATTVFAEARLREKAVCTAQCHLGAELVYQPTVATLSVARFDHGKHLEKGDLACTDCHDLDADLRPDDMRKADLALCARCHSHNEKQVDKFRRTGAGGACNSEGALGGKGIESCTKKCHVVDATESMLLSHQPARMSQFALQGGRQFHEKLAEGEQCRSCHAWDTPPTDRVNERLIVYSHVSVHGSRRSFAEMGKYKVPDALMPKLQGTSKLDCAVCHRREQTLRDYQR